jgi:thioredoxin-like negative regulator of GroEL
MSPFVQTQADKVSDQVDFVEIDVSTNGDIAAQYSIRRVPTLIAEHDGVVVDRTVGAHTPGQLEAFFSGAANGEAARLGLAPRERAMRLGAAAAVLVVGLIADQPIIVAMAAGLLFFGTYDIVMRCRT